MVILFPLLEKFFFFFLQNQSLIEPCPKPACLALPRGKTVVLFISQLKVVLRKVLIVLHMPHWAFSAATGSTVAHCERPGLINALGMQRAPLCQPISARPLAFYQLVTLVEYGARRDCSIPISTFKPDDVRVKLSVKVIVRLQQKPQTRCGLCFEVSF